MGPEKRCTRRARPHQDHSPRRRYRRCQANAQVCPRKGKTEEKSPLTRPTPLEISRLECAVTKMPSRNSFHEKADPCQEFFALSRFLPFSPSCQAASVATLPSALFWERGSLGASWVF